MKLTVLLLLLDLKKCTCPLNFFKGANGIIVKNKLFVTP